MHQCTPFGGVKGIGLWELHGRAGVGSEETGVEEQSVS
jgi:hypothetical protein